MLIQDKANQVNDKIDSSVKFDPMTIMAIISIIVAVVRLVSACSALWKVRRPGPFARLRLKAIIKHYCDSGRFTEQDRQEVFRAVLAIGKSTSDKELVEMNREVVGGNYPEEEIPE